MIIEELAPAIAHRVRMLRDAAVQTFQSCETAAEHAYPTPTVRFHADNSEGFRGLAVALEARLPVAELRRVWVMQDEEPTGPWWELVFVPREPERSGGGEA